AGPDGSGRLLRALPDPARPRGGGAPPAAGRTGQADEARRGPAFLIAMETAAAQTGPAPASLIVIDPNGHRTRVALASLPFRIGRQPDNDLVLRDSRASRLHARIGAEDNHYVVEDAGSRHGTFVNGKRIQ